MGDREVRADFNGSNYEDRFVGDLVSFVAGEKFQRLFENFFVEHAMEFNNSEEHKLEWYAIYQEFHSLFEEQLEEFCESKGFTQGEFMAKCREASTEDPKAKHYISILLSSVEYDTFVKLMKIMRPVAERRLAAAALIAAATAKAEAKKAEDAKGGGGDGLSADGQDSGSKAAPSAAEPGGPSEKASAKGGDEDDSIAGSKGVVEDDELVADAKADSKASADDVAGESKGSK